MNIGRILVATDFSEPSQRALEYARLLHNLFRGSLHIVHVVHEDAPAVFGLNPGETTHFAKETADAQLQALVTEADRTLGVHLMTLEGDPVDEILRYADEHDIDLIVMGTHGRGFIGHLLLGNVSAKVLRRAHRPVVTVPPLSRAINGQSAWDEALTEARRLIG